MCNALLNETMPNWVPEPPQPPDWRSATSADPSGDSSALVALRKGFEVVGGCGGLAATATNHLKLSAPQARKQGF